MRYAALIFCMCAHSVLAQQRLHSVSMFTSQNGLSDNTIQCITQDSRGFLWIGTKEGLNRFDGYRFRKIFSEKEASTGLAANTITGLLEYKKGWLLIATSNGLSVLNTSGSFFENGKIKKQEIKAGSGTVINSLFQDNKKNIWVNYNGEMDVLDSNLQFMYRFTDLPWARPVKGTIVAPDNWFADKMNRFWLAGDTSGIQIIDFDRQVIWNNRNNPHQYEFLKANYIRSLFLDVTSNTLWYAPWGSGVYRYDLITNTQQQQNFGGRARKEFNSINKIKKIAAGKILCGGGKGCFTVDEKTLTYERVLADMNHVIALFKTKDGHFWAGTTNGLFQLENETEGSVHLDFNLNGKPIPWVQCTGIRRSSSGNLYLSNCENALIEVEKQFRNYNMYPVPGKNAAIISLQEDEQGGLWIGTSRGLYRFDVSSKRFSQPAGLHPDLYDSHINYIFCDRDKDYWVATRYPFGLYRYSRRKRVFEKIKNVVTDHFETLGFNSRISFMSEDIKNQLWMGSHLGGGLICFNKKNESWNIYPKKESRKSLLSRGLGDMYPDDKDNLWLHDLHGAGLIRYYYKNDSVSFVTRHDGLPSDFISGICPDGQGNLWVLTEYGISRFNLEKNKTTYNILFKAKPDFPAEFMMFDELSKSLVCASKNRLQLYPVASEQPGSNEILKPFVDKVWVNNKEINADVNGLELKLKPDQKNISIDFTAVHYSNADKIKFAYQLAGADQDWKYADANRTAQYAVLTPGKYIFMIKAADVNGIWGSPINAFAFSIVPRFWQTNLFRVSMVVLLFAASWILVRRRIKHIRHEAEMKRKIAETEMMALRSQMNPHFIFNCLNAIDNLIQTNQKEKATTYLARFAKLIRNVLDSSKNNTVLFQKDMESLELYLQIEQFRSNDKFEYEMDIDPELRNSDFKVPPLIIQPFVENAIHHGLLNKQAGERKLIVTAKLENNYIYYSVRDNGVGRKKAAEIKALNKPGNLSYGIDITRERLILHNQDRKIDHLKIYDLYIGEEPAGTKAEIRIKIADQT